MLAQHTGKLLSSFGIGGKVELVDKSLYNCGQS